VAELLVVVGTASDSVAKQVILWYIYPSLVGENSSGNLPFVARFFI